MDVSMGKLLFEGVFEASNDAMFFIDNQGIVQLINSKARKLIGEDQQDIVHRLILEVLPELDQFEDVFCVAAKTEFESNILNIPSKIIIHPIQPTNENILGRLIIIRDISDKKALRGLQEELQDIIEGISDGVFVADGMGNVLYMNSACSEITGLIKEMCIGRNVKDLVAEGIILESSTLSVLKSRHIEVLWQRNVKGKTVLVTGKPIFDTNGNIRHIVSSSRDVTDLNHLKNQLEKERVLSQRYHSELISLRTMDKKNEIVVKSEKMIKLLETVAHVARSDATILLNGESGVGKDVICRFIHAQSSRAQEAFIKINCAAIPENLLEAELFGYADGAYTGARKGGKAGLIELADKGTLFLDEIGEMPLFLQPKLLQVIQEKTFLSVGDTKTKTVDIRIIAATNKNLKEMVSQGKFRLDLFYRLNVVPITIPPLRERGEDIPLLIYHFVSRFNQKYRVDKNLSNEAMDILQAYNWPGNVRELENCIEHLVVIGEDEIITPDQLPAHMRTIGNQNAVIVTGLIPWNQAVEELEKQLITKAYEKAGSTHKAAKLLGVSQPTIVRKLSKIKEFLYKN
ncbi:MAG: sigma-L-dependent transcriptional regulator [Firmicutes bacterium]|nr:sigma-L-dependent transcriptional regulator [Bacillota bacterium]